MNREGESIVYIERYFILLAKDLADSEAALAENLPQQIRLALEDERKKLLALNDVLNGADDKSTLHRLRANLRWARQRLTGERDAVKRKKLEHEVSSIEADIKREVERQKV